MFGAPTSEPQATLDGSDTDWSRVLSAVTMVCNMLERDQRPVRSEAAEELRNAIAAVMQASATPGQVPALVDLTTLPLHYKEGIENGGYYLATDVIRAQALATSRATSPAKKIRLSTLLECGVICLDVMDTASIKREDEGIEIQRRINDAIRKHDPNGEKGVDE